MSDKREEWEVGRTVEGVELGSGDVGYSEGQGGFGKW